ncbi:MAG TPA: DUF1345 domain-containing protein [Acidimicrobiales bacterium]
MALPVATTYHRWMGWHAPALRRLVVAGAAGAAVGLGLAVAVPWQLALLGAWNAVAVVFLATVLPIVLGADASATRRLAVREDVNRDEARLLLLAASGVSLAAVGFALGLAERQHGADRVVLVAAAALTVVVSWTVVNTIFTLRYAHLYYRGAAPTADTGADPVDFGGGPGPPDYRDFAYLAFTVGMTYQVSDTNLRDRRIRRAVLVHGLISYLFGVFIVAAGVNVVAGLLG